MNEVNMTLASVAELSREIGRPHGTVWGKIEELGLKPVHTMTGNGKRVVRLFDREPTMEALRAAFPEPQPEPKAPVAEPALAFPLAVQQSLDRIEVAQETADQEAARLLRLLMEQNVVLLRQINSLRADTLAKLEALQSDVDRLLHPAPAPAVVAPPAPKAQPEAPKATRKPKVAVLGLHPSAANTIEREFGGAMELTFYTSEEANGRAFENRIVGFEAVLVMMAGMNNGLISLHRSGAKFQRITGGITTLRDKLTTLYVDLVDSQEAA